MNRFVAFALLFIGVLPPALVHADNIRFTPRDISWSDWTGNTDPVPIPADGFRMSFHGGGGTTLMNDVLLIIGVPTTGAAPTLTADEWAAGLTSVTAGPAVLHGTWSSATPDSNVYEFLDLPNTGGGNSQNYANWSTPGIWHDPLGETAWDIYTFALTFAPLMDDTDGNYVEFVSSIPVGSYLAGFACHENGTPCGTPGKTEGTPFTGAGFVVPPSGTPFIVTPEPSSFILLGLSFGALGLGRRRSNFKSTAA